MSHDAVEGKRGKEDKGRDSAERSGEEAFSLFLLMLCGKATLRKPSPVSLSLSPAGSLICRPSPDSYSFPPALSLLLIIIISCSTSDLIEDRHFQTKQDSLDPTALLSSFFRKEDGKVENLFFPSHRVHGCERRVKTSLSLILNRKSSQVIVRLRSETAHS